MIDRSGVGIRAFAASKAFHTRARAALGDATLVAPEAGGTCDGPPGLRPHDRPNYHGAFAHDPDGHDIEAVCHDPEDAS